MKEINDWQVLTPDGFRDFKGITNQGIKDIYEHRKLKGSANHRIKVDNKFKTLKEVGVPLNYKDETYDLIDVDNKEHSYITNNIISHNCQFIGQSGSLFSSEVLQSLEFKVPIEFLYGNEFHIYTNPIKEHEYVLAVDPADGGGGNSDFSVINVIDISSTPINQAAMYRSNTTSQIELAYIIEKIAENYNHALVIVENNFGKVCLDRLFNEIEYDNIYNTTKAIGMRTTIKTKREGVMHFKSLVDNHGIIINSKEFLEEASNFTINTNGTYSAASGSHDDIIMSFIIFAYISNTEYFKEYADRDFMAEIHKKHIKEIYEEEEILPMFSSEVDMNEDSFF